MWSPVLLVACIACLMNHCAASTTVIPRPPRSIYIALQPEEPLVTVSARPERAATPSDQPKQIPPPPPPGHSRFNQHTTPEYELPVPPPRQMRLLWAQDFSVTPPFIPRLTPQPAPHTAVPTWA